MNICSVRYAKLQDLIQTVAGVWPVKRKGRNGDIRREDVLEMCEKYIVKASIQKGEQKGENIGGKGKRK